MNRAAVLNTSVVAASIRPLTSTSNALRKVGTTPYFAASRPASYRLFSTTKTNQFTKTTPNMTVHTIAGQSSFDEKVVEGSKEQLILLDCFATWCGPCKAIAPVLAEWSNDSTFSKVGFYKIDVDESPDVAQALGIRAMPTFLLFKDGQKVGEFVGADQRGLKTLLTQNL